MFWFSRISKEKVIVLQLQGGLGNQMFQFAIGSILASKSNSKLKIDNRFFDNSIKVEGFTPRQFELSVFDNQYMLATTSDVAYFYKLSKWNQLKKWLGLDYPKIYTEPCLGFHDAVLNLRSPVCIRGYFQSYRYFEDHDEDVRSLFSFSKIKLDNKNAELLKQIKNKKTVSLHIRRGDYVADKLTNEFHGSCSKEYYLQAIKQFEEINEEFTFVFFSDDMDWVKGNFNDLLISKVFVDVNIKDNSWKDMLLMSACKHNIIANSSFSWWGAWLNSNQEKIVIAPKIWFLDHEANSKVSDLIPDSWIRL